MKKNKKDVFQAIADPTRRAIIALIAIQAMTPGTIAEHFKTTRQAVSKHIKILAECKILKQEIKGREIYYHFDANKIKEVADFTEPFRKMWDDRFNKLESVMKKYKARA
jgi:DNA-binding transcriptional ArsR family regulator